MRRSALHPLGLCPEGKGKTATGVPQNPGRWRLPAKVRNVTELQQRETITVNHAQTPKKSAVAERFTLSQAAGAWSLFVTINSTEVGGNRLMSPVASRAGEAAANLSQHPTLDTTGRG
jgi:hypothetical protein